VDLRLGTRFRKNMGFSRQKIRLDSNSACSSRFPLLSPATHLVSTPKLSTGSDNCIHIRAYRRISARFSGSFMHSAKDKHSNALARYSLAAALIRNSQSSPARGTPNDLQPRNFRAYRPHLLRQKKPMLIDADTLMIKTMQQVGDFRRNRLVQNVSV
jgi:hypothetical protein